MDGLPQDSEPYKRLKEVCRASSRALELVKQILAFSRKSEEKRVPLQLQPILKEALRMLRGAADDD